MKKSIFYIVLFTSIALDLYTKFISFSHLDKKINIIWDFLYLQLLMNPGIAFWVQLDQIVIKILTICLILWIFYYYFSEERKEKSILTDVAFWMILWGAIWNGIERVFRWEVVDFIWVKYFSVFNIADICITLWAILYIIALYSDTPEK